MANRKKNPLEYPDVARSYAEAALIGEAADMIKHLLEESGMKQKDLADKLSVTEGRISQMLVGPGNLTLRSLAALGWAIGGVRFQLNDVPIQRHVLNHPAPVNGTSAIHLTDWFPPLPDEKKRTAAKRELADKKMLVKDNMLEAI